MITGILNQSAALNMWDDLADQYIEHRATKLRKTLGSCRRTGRMKNLKRAAQISRLAPLPWRPKNSERVSQRRSFNVTAAARASVRGTELATRRRERGFGKLKIKSPAEGPSAIASRKRGPKSSC